MEIITTSLVLLIFAHIMRYAEYADYNKFTLNLFFSYEGKSTV
jgi:hypothetical protein